MKKTRIFINYRRDDTGGYANLLHYRLVQEFGPDHVFLDVDTIAPGIDFVSVLTEKVESCDIFLAVIGRHWLTIADSTGIPRIQKSDDFVAIEIGAALQRRVPVIPILVGGARMPEAKELPEPLKPLSRRQAYALPDRGLVPAIEKLLQLLLNPQALMQSIPPADSNSNYDLLTAGAFRINPTDGLGYVWIPRGVFVMGCAVGDKDCPRRELPIHRVEITRGFWLSETPVTQAAYESVMGENPSRDKSPQRPVEMVTWRDACRYCEKTGLRLPTEAEWEYAARAHDATGRYGELDQIAWYRGNSDLRTHDVKGRQPNAWGLYDILGNVMEWVSDWYEESYYERSESHDPIGPKKGKFKVARGGSWCFGPADCLASFRNYLPPEHRNGYTGFRSVAPQGMLINK